VKIVLISPYSSIISIGLRYVSSSLKEAGHDVKMIFLTTSHLNPILEYSQSVIKNVLEACEDASLIGISVMAEYFLQSRQLTEEIKKAFKVPIVWGGIQPTSKPDEAISCADIVCLGEGEEAMVELATKMEKEENYFTTKNMWFKNKGTIIRNNMRLLVQDLDSIAFMDYNIDTHFILSDNNKIMPLTAEKMKDILKTETFSIFGKISYQTMFTRGCPYKCTYCCNDIYHKLYKGQKLVRKRSPENVIKEILNIKENFDFINAILFHDDSFFALSEEQIEKFSTLYKEKLNSPFFVLGDPKLTSEKKISLLVNAGLCRVQVGVQTGSHDILNLYRRKHFNPENTIKLGKMLNKYKDKVTVIYDVITDNPFEKKEDILSTIHLFLKIPYPYIIQLFSLTFFPGTELYEKARLNNFLHSEVDDIYRKRYFKIRPTYMNLILKLFSKNVPKFFIKLLISSPVLFLFNRKWTSYFIKYLF